MKKIFNWKQFNENYMGGEDICHGCREHRTECTCENCQECGNASHECTCGMEDENGDSIPDRFKDIDDFDENGESIPDGFKDIDVFENRKQKKIAAMAEPKDKINGKDFAALRSKKKGSKRESDDTDKEDAKDKKGLTPGQKKLPEAMQKAILKKQK